MTCHLKSLKWTFYSVPVLLLIQMRLSEPTVDAFPTATVSGTCHCKLQRGRVMSATGPTFTASAFRWRDIRGEETERGDGKREGNSCSNQRPSVTWKCPRVPSFSLCSVLFGDFPHFPSWSEGIHQTIRLIKASWFSQNCIRAELKWSRFSLLLRC